MLVQKAGPRWSLTPYPDGGADLPEGQLVLVGTREMPAPEELAAGFTAAASLPDE